MRLTFLLGIIAFSLTSLSVQAAVSITGIADKTKYPNTCTYTVVADGTAGTTTTATLNGVPTTVGSAVVLTTVRYHELLAESRDAGGALVSSQLVRFIVHNSVRNGSEDGIPSHTPYKSVQDAPSAFAGKTFKAIAPAAWPVGLPMPLAVKLVDGANETVRLNGLVAMSGFPSTKVQMRRGWGSVQVPAATAAGTVNVGAALNGLVSNPAVTFEAAPVFTTVSGIIGNTTWPPNSRIHVTGGLTVSAGATLTVGAGSIVKIYSGTATNGSAAELRIDGNLVVNGTEANPVTFCPDTAGGRWGGIELRVATSNVTAQWAFFTGSGEDESWTTNNSGVAGATHQPQQMLFLVVGSGAGTAIGAQLHLADCFAIDNQQIMNSKTNVWIDLSRTLYQRAVTSGELTGAKVTIDSSALIEFPSETGTFADGDNDGLYMQNGDLSLTNNIIGFTKDDGVDSGGSGGTSPFGTIDPDTGTTTTRYDSTNNWYEGTTHEGNSLSGQRNVYFTGCVFLNCGQGVEAGYSNSGTSDGPHAKVDGCLFSNNMVGVRWGDNYGSGYSYNAAFEVKNSLILNSVFKDAFSGQWHPTQTNAWIYQTTNLNSFGNPYFNVHDNHISQPDSRHPLNTTWNPANPAHAALIEPFMPVPGSNVGVAISTYQATQSDTAAYAATFTARLSSFSSKQVAVGWAVFGKTDPLAEAETTLASGTLTFQPGDTLEDFTANVATPGNYGLIRVALGNPVNAEVTGEQVYIKLPASNPPQTYQTYGSGGTGAAGVTGTAGALWKVKADFTTTTLAAFITANGTTWKNEIFDDSSWPTVRTHTGFGDGDENQTLANVDYDTVAAGTQTGPSFLFRNTFTIADVAALGSVTGEVKSDDGAVVYINGTEIFRSPNVAAALTAYANVGIAAAPADNLTAAITVPLNLLHNGVNTIAVSVHQYNNTSSDLTFDLRLTGTPNAVIPLALNFGKTGGQPVMWWFGPNDLLEHSYDLINWFPAPVTGSPVTITPSGPKEFFRLKR